jgi:hypothetical protein
MAARSLLMSAATWRSTVISALVRRDHSSSGYVESDPRMKYFRIFCPGKKLRILV